MNHNQSHLKRITTPVASDSLHFSLLKIHLTEDFRNVATIFLKSSVKLTMPLQLLLEA